MVKPNGFSSKSGKRRVVVVVRERGGRTLTTVSRTGEASVAKIIARIVPGTTIHAN